MAADYSRIHRLLKILTLIQGSSGWTPRRLALECQTTERTIYRDLRMLQGAGIPYFFDEETGGYAVRRDFFMPPVQLTLDETLALAALAEHVGAKEQVPFTKAAGKAITKIRSLLPPSIRTELEQIEEHVQIKLAAANPPEAAADVYDMVRTALSKKQVLRCRYDSASKSTGKSGNEEIFLLRPFALLFNQRAWYVIGHHGKRGEVRCLKLSRFTMTQPTNEKYTIPKTFSLAKHLGNAWRMIKGKTTYDVELRFDAEFSDTIADTHWHPTQEVLYNEDGSIIFRCKVDGLDEIVWWVLSMGPHCMVKQPKDLAENVKELAREIVRCYGVE